MPDSNNSLDLEAQRVLHDPKRSSVEKYMLLAIGEKSWSRLIKYEFITTLFGGWPGALGLFLRQKAYRALFQSMGRGVTIGRNVTIRGAGRISLGRNVHIDAHCLIDARGAGASIAIGDGVFIGRNTIVRCRGEHLRIGEGTDIGVNCVVATDSRLDIGKDVLVAAYSYIAAGGRHRYDDKTVPIIKQGFDSRGGITVGDGAWIGSHSILTDGSSVGAGTIIGAHSLVNNAIPEMVMAYGSPARVQKPR